MEKYELMRFREALRKINPSKPLFLDTETIGLYGNVRLLQIYQENWERVVIVDIKKEVGLINFEELTKFYLIGFNLQYDFNVMGIKPLTKKFDDLFLASRIKFYDQKSFNLEAVLSYIGIKTSENKKLMQKSRWDSVLSSEQLNYAAEDVFYLPQLYNELIETIQTPLYKLDKITSRILLEVEEIGLNVDKERLKVIKQEFEEKLTVLTKEIPFNYNSSQQAKKFFGTDKADVNVLKDLILQGNEIASKVYEAKKIDKRINFLKKYDKNRVYGHFTATGTVSGRMSCSNENIQQIPRELKQIFGFPKKDKVYIGIDFPQIELRLAVSIWGEPTMEHLFKEGVDLHKYTAAQIYGKSINEINKQERQIAKSANFGLLYGMGVARFREYVKTQTGIILTEEETKKVRDTFFNTYTGFKIRHREVGGILNRYGVYEGSTVLGRKYKTTKFTDALNIQIQGSGAELFKIGLKDIRTKISNIKITNLVHDAYVFEANPDEAEELAREIIKILSGSWVKFSSLLPKCKDLPLPLEADIDFYYDRV